MFFLCLVTVVLLIPALSLIPVSGAGTKGYIPRHEILYTTGYHVRPPAFNPEWHWGYCFGAYFMFDPLFDWNNTDPDHPVLMNFLGTNITWADSGKRLDITMREGCKWSDGKPITAYDVNYTYVECVHDVDIFDKTTGITIASDYSFSVNLKPEFAYSQQIYDIFTRRKGILPLHVWPEAKEEHGNNEWWAWTNDWFDSEYKSEWKVVSGPYKPYYYSDTQDEEIFVINEKYWGFDSSVTKSEIEKAILRTAADHPKYIAHLHYPSNAAGATALMRDEIDWSAKFVPQVWEVMQANPNITTYTDGKAPYYKSESSVVELCFNMQRFPFTEKWFREMLGYAIDYNNAINVAASGYIRRARVGRIDNETATQRPYYDPDVEAKYAFVFNLTRALEILDENTFVHTDGKRYTNDVTSEYVSLAPPDAFPAMNGHQALLANRTFQIYVPADWSDSVALTQAVSYSINGLGIPCVAKPVDASVWDGGFVTQTYDLAYHTGSAKTQQPAFEAFNWMLGKPSTWDHNPWNWKYGYNATVANETIANPYYDATFQELVDDFDVAPAGSQEAKDIASDLQEIIAEELPSIPIAYNAMWYTVNTKYWTNFPTESNNWLQVTAVWSTAYPGAMNRLVMGLNATGLKEEAGAASISLMPVLFAFAALGIVIRKRKQR